MPYWRVPDRLYDEPDEMLAWARASVGAAHRITAERTEKARAKPKAERKRKTSPASA